MKLIMEFDQAFVPENDVTAAITDRLMQKAHRVVITGWSGRKVLKDRNLHLEHEHDGDMEFRLKWVLSQFNLWSEENTFTFPDGETWTRDDQE